MIPYLVALVLIPMIARSSDRMGERRWHLVGCAIAGMMGYVICGAFGNSLFALLIGLSVAATGIIGSFGLFWLLPSRMLSGVAAAAGIALINSIGQIGGVIGPYAVGLVKDATGSADMALYGIAAVCGFFRRTSRMVPASQPLRTRPSSKYRSTHRTDGRLRTGFAESLKPKVRQLAADEIRRRFPFLSTWSSLNVGFCALRP